MFGFLEQNQDGYLDSADESLHTVPRACNSSGVEANEDELDPWGESEVNPSLGVDEVDDDSSIGVSNTGREIVLTCFHIPSTNIIALCLKNTANQEYSINIVFLNKCIHCLLMHCNCELGLDSSEVDSVCSIYLTLCLLGMDQGWISRT